MANWIWKHRMREAFADKRNKVPVASVWDRPSEILIGCRWSKQDTGCAGLVAIRPEGRRIVDEHDDRRYPFSNRI